DAGGFGSAGLVRTLESSDDVGRPAGVPRVHAGVRRRGIGGAQGRPERGPGRGAARPAGQVPQLRHDERQGRRAARLRRAFVGAVTGTTKITKEHEEIFLTRKSSCVFVPFVSSWFRRSVTRACLSSARSSW